MKKEKSVFDAKVINLAEPSMTPLPYRSKDFEYRDFIPFGNDNLFPQALALFARSSPNHRGVIDSKNVYFLGDGIQATDEKDKEVVSWLDNINFEKQNINELQNKFFLDEIIFNNSYVEIITDAKRSFLWINHIDSTKCRKSLDGKYIIMHPDWSQDTGKADKKRKVYPIYPNFERIEDEKYAPLRSIYHKFDYEPEFTFYGIPKYISGRDSIMIDMKTNRWNLSRLKNAFSLSGIFLVPVKDNTESAKVLKYIDQNFKGEEKAGKLLTITKSRAQDNEKADRAQLIETKQDNDGNWINLHKQSLSDIVIAHNWYRSLTGIADNTGFDTQRILNEYQVAQKTIISRAQKSWVDLYKRIAYEVQGKEIDITFKNSPPLNDFRYYKIWEIRQSKGLEFDENDPAQQEIIKTN